MEKERKGDGKKKKKSAFPKINKKEKKKLRYSELEV